MKAIVVYDSVYGNTEQIALAIADALGTQAEVAHFRVNAVQVEQLTGVELLIVGSPTQRFRPTAPISNLLKNLANKSLKGVRVAAFDTRLTTDKIEETPALAFFVRLFGHSAYAAKPMGDMLKKKGGEQIVPPEGFFVEGIEGPLAQGELERAANWVKQIIARTRGEGSP